MAGVKIKQYYRNKSHWHKIKVEVAKMFQTKKILYVKFFTPLEKQLVGELTPENNPP